MALTENETREDENEASLKKIIIRIILFLLFIGIILFCYCFFFNSSSKQSDANKTNTENLESDTTNTGNLENNSEVLAKVLESVYEKNIYQLSSSEATGFYVMVGSFLDYENAVTLASMNPTDFSCQIFEVNEESFNRVGLFISETDVEMAEMVLDEVRNMQADSWLLYNTQN